MIIKNNLSDENSLFTFFRVRRLNSLIINIRIRIKRIRLIYVPEIAYTVILNYSINKFGQKRVTKIVNVVVALLSIGYSIWLLMGLSFLFNSF